MHRVGGRQDFFSTSFIPQGRTQCACRCAADFYNPLVLDIKFIREKPDFVRQRLATRGAGDEKLIDGILQADDLRRKALVEVETLKATRNRVS